MARRHLVADAEIAALTEEVRKLRSDLWMARRDLVDLMPPELEAILTGYYSAGLKDSPYPWADQMVEELLKHAAPRPWREMAGASSISDRALCPLCGRGSDNPFGEQGFAFPEGLRRHLAGSYNARQCRVARAAIDLAWSHVKQNKEKGDV